MHERHGAECGFTGRTAGDREAGRITERDTPDAGELHEEIVRMLAVDEWPPVKRFSSLKDFGVAQICRQSPGQG